MRNKIRNKRWVLTTFIGKFCEVPSFTHVQYFSRQNFSLSDQSYRQETDIFLSMTVQRKSFDRLATLPGYCGTMNACGAAAYGGGGGIWPKTPCCNASLANYNISIIYFIYLFIYLFIIKIVHRLHDRQKKTDKQQKWKKKKRKKDNNIKRTPFFVDDNQTLCTSIVLLRPGYWQ